MRGGLVFVRAMNKRGCLHRYSDGACCWGSWPAAIVYTVLCLHRRTNKSTTQNTEAEHDGEHRSRECLCQRAARRAARRDGVGAVVVAR